MDLYYRWAPSFGNGYGPPTTKDAAVHLSAAAARLAYSMAWAIPNLPTATKQEFLRIVSVDSLWALAVVFAGWLIATIIGGPIGTAVNLLLILYGISGLWSEIKHAAAEAKAWALAAYEARAEADLERAGQHFAKALSAGLLNVIEVIVTHRAFRSIEGQIKKRYPAPKELQREFDQALQRGKAKTTGEKTVGGRGVKAAEKILKTAEGIASGSRGRGMRDAADEFPSPDFPTGLVVGAVVAVGAGVGLALALGKDKKNG